VTPYEAEIRESSRLEREGWTWREAQGLSAEWRNPRYQIWWRCTQASDRRFAELMADLISGPEYVAGEEAYWGRCADL
jgi:hypothetical protein